MSETEPMGAKVRRAVPAATGPILVAVFPVLAYGVSVVSQAGRRPVLGSDYAVIEMWTRSASQGDAYLGPYSRFGWNHPGPAVFYYFAPFFRLSGQRPGSLAVASVLAVVVGLGFTVWTVHRVLGRRASWIAAVLLLAFLATAGVRWSDDTWNPVLIIVPLVVFGVSVAAVVEGHRWFFLVAVVSASVCVQTHLGTLPVVTALAVVAIVAVAVRWWRTGEQWGRPVLAGLVAFGMLWALPLYEQFTRTPGNIDEIVDFTGRTTGIQHTWASVEGLIAVQTTFFGRNLVDRSIYERQSSPSGVVTIVAAILLGVGVLAAVRNVRHRRWFAAVLCGSPLPALALLAYTLVRAEGPTYPYVTLSAMSVGVLLYLGLAVTAIDLLGQVRFPAFVLRTAPFMIGMMSLLLVVGGVTDHLVDRVFVRRSNVRYAAETVKTIKSELPRDRGSVHVVIGDHPTWPQAAAIANQLEESGYHVTVDEDWVFMFGDQRMVDRCEQAVVRLDTASDAPPVGRGPNALHRVGRAADDIVSMSVPRVQPCRG